MQLDELLVELEQLNHHLLPQALDSFELNLVKCHQIKATHVLQEMNQHQRQPLGFSGHHNKPKLLKPLQYFAALLQLKGAPVELQIHLYRVDLKQFH